jgi:hypothetical protein
VVTLDRDDILAALDELLDVLIAAGAHAHIRIVGGAAIAVRFARDTTTTDVDALYGSAPEVEAAAQHIARRRGWPDDWLNDKVKAFASHFDSPDDWVCLDARQGVEVRIADAPLLLAIKLRAARGRRDAADIDLLLDACGIDTAEAALAVFERYYPEELLPQRAHAQLAARFR